jgi:hypothetical protein
MTRPTKFDLMRIGRKRLEWARSRWAAAERFEKLRRESIEAGWDVDSKLEVMQQAQRDVEQILHNPPSISFGRRPRRRWWHALIAFATLRSS